MRSSPKNQVDFMKYMDTSNKLKGDYTIGSNPCKICKKKFGTLLTVDADTFYDDDLLCFNCYVHRHGVASGMRVKDQLNMVAGLQWEFTSKELSVHPQWKEIFGVKK